MYFVDFAVEIVVMVLSSDSTTTLFFPILLNIPVNVIPLWSRLLSGAGRPGVPCGYGRPGYPPPGYPTPGVMIWAKPGKPASSREVSNNVNPRDIDLPGRR